MAAEVAVYAVGLVVIRALLDTPRAPLAWVTVVVGVHFSGLAVVWREHRVVRSWNGPGRRSAERRPGRAVRPALRTTDRPDIGPCPPGPEP